MRRLAAVLAVVASGLTVAGCGGDALSLDPVAQAAEKTSKAGAAKFDMQLDFAVNGQHLRADGTGVGGDEGMQMAIDFAEILRASGQNVGGPALMRFVADTR